MASTELIKVTKVDQALLDEIMKRIKEVIAPLKIILFGSYARGNHNPDSDLDILVVINENGIPKRKIASKVYSALSGILIPKDIIIATPAMIEEWRNVKDAFLTTIMDTGKVIYEK